MTEQLSISSEMFAALRDQFDVVLNSLVQLTGSSDESELTLKLKLHKEYIDEGEPELTEQLKASWTVTRTIKAKSYKIEGRVMDDYVIQKDDAGKIYVLKAQTSIFDNWKEEAEKIFESAEKEFELTKEDSIDEDL